MNLNGDALVSHASGFRTLVGLPEQDSAPKCSQACSSRIHAKLTRDSDLGAVVSSLKTSIDSPGFQKIKKDTSNDESESFVIEWLIELADRVGPADMVPAPDGLVRQQVCDGHSRWFMPHHRSGEQPLRARVRQTRPAVRPRQRSFKVIRNVELSGMDREIVEIIGFFAAGMTVTAFYCKTMLKLRVAAIFANLLFIIYGSGLDLKPVLALHCILLPLNCMRLIKVMRERSLP